jgi:exopolysaccharide biosynthesis polyprenyl glycosylphosphotransferase
MKTKHVPAGIALLLGDLVAFYGALWLSLFLRTFTVPSSEYYLEHAAPFSFVAIAWIVSLYVMGLYETDTGSPRARVPSAVISASFVGTIASLLVFYAVPFFGIAPKTILVLHVILLAAGLWSWRIYIEPRISRRDRRAAIVVGGGEEFRELVDALSSARSFHPLRVVASYDIELNSVESADIGRFVRDECEKRPVVLVVDVAHPALKNVLPRLYELSFVGARIVDLRSVYEEEFGKVPVSSVDHGWLLANTSTAPHMAYDAAKRLMDIVVATLALVLTSPFLIFAAIAIKIEDRGDILITQERVGRFGVPFRIRKLRTMTSSENGAWVGETNNRVTRIGHFLRRSSIDELPQLFSVIAGRMSLIGPRPDMTGLEERLSAEIPYYRARYLVKPGLSGWAQVRQRVVPQTLEQSRERLAYDLYYVRHRSIFLDASIVFRTARALVRRLVG